jgi:hypothetical protein
LDFAFRDAVQHLGIGCGRFGPEIAVVGREIAKILGNGFHR